MFYFVATKSGHEIQIDEKQKEKIEAILTRGQQKHVSINDNLISIVDISGIFDEPKTRKGQFFCSHGQWHLDDDVCQCARTYNQKKEAEIDEAHQIEAGQRCRGQYSISFEITEIIRSEYGPRWIKRVGDRALREEIRQKLRTTPANWCDTVTGECSCEPSYKPDPGRIDPWKTIFPANQKRRWNG